jgi:hypothetical protein
MRKEYTVLEDSVNLAARLMEHVQERGQGFTLRTRLPNTQLNTKSRDTS